MIVYIAVGLTLVYALVKERSMLGCKVIPDADDCDNANGKVVKGCSPNASDTDEQLVNKLVNSAHYCDRIVVWRQAVILSFLSATLIWFILKERFPTEYELLVSMLVMSALIYFTSGFYKFHMHDYVRQNIVDAALIIKERLKNEAQQPKQQ